MNHQSKIFSSDLGFSSDDNFDIVVKININMHPYSQNPTLCILYQFSKN